MQKLLLLIVLQSGNTAPYCWVFLGSVSMLTSKTRCLLLLDTAAGLGVPTKHAFSSLQGWKRTLKGNDWAIWEKQS
jgi:hypothetical protein